MFAAAGYEATSLRQIAGAADVDLATLKYHFGSKALLFAAVYREGHEAFLGVLGPFLASSSAVRTPSEVRSVIETLATDASAFIADNEWFVRLFLYRLLEDASDMSVLEEELQGQALNLLGSGLESLAERGLIRPVDARAFISFLVVGLPMWVVASRNKPAWLGAPSPVEPEGRERFEAFVRELLVRLLAV